MNQQEHKQIMDDPNRPYAYSFDRESGFRGAFATREQAAEAGQEKAREGSTPIQAVFVGKRVAVDPQSEGHADFIARSMRARMQAKTGTTGYLADANEHLLADLDTAIATTINGWLKRHELSPASKISSISEHPLLTPHEHPVDRTVEVGLIGGEE